jgi:hypothetical protein
MLRHQPIHMSIANYKPKSSKEATLQSLYAPPSEILCHENFLIAREVAKSNRKWLLVNINDNENFASHTLNRDVWKDDGVQNVIQLGYIFWQQVTTDAEGVIFVQRYKVANFPFVAVVDPRTGALLCDFKQKLSLDAVCERCKLPIMRPLDSSPLITKLLRLVTDYLYSNPYPEDSDPLASVTVIGSSSYATGGKRDEVVVDSDEDDDDVAAAIALSLAEASKVAPEPASSTSVASAPSAHTTTAIFSHGGFRLTDASPYTPSSLSTAAAETVKLQFRLPNQKRIQQSFFIHDDIKVVAAHVASELQAIDMPSKSSSFEMYLVYPRRAFSVAMQSILESSSTSTNLANETQVDSNTGMNGIEADGVVSLSSLGITKDTSVAVEFL